MKLFRRFIILGVISGAFLGVVAGISAVSAETTPLTEGQISKIRENCQSIKNTLNQLHASDALLRVNRGKVYEALSTKLMEPFNTRLSNNGQDNRATASVASRYRTALDTFRSDYISYEEKLSATIKMDCQKDPAAFHYALDDARTKRATVHEDVQKLHQLIDDYESAADDFLLNYQRNN